MSLDTPIVPLERPLGRELFTVMASLLAHVLRHHE